LIPLDGTKQKHMLVTNELQLQAECFHWRDTFWIPELGEFCLRGKCFRIKNELDNHPKKTFQQMQAQLAENRGTGITKGIWDELIMRTPRTWIEFKFGKNGLSQEQKQFMEIGLELGDEFHIARTLNEYKEIIYGIIEEDYRIIYRVPND
jgi:hypothetical protein